MKKQIIIDQLEILLAVGLLEYHDKNWLAWSNKKRNEEKREILMSVMRQLHQLKAE